MDLFNATENGSNASFQFSNGRMISANLRLELASFISEQLQAMYEMQPLEGTEYEGSRGNGHGGGNPKREKLKEKVDVTDQILRSNEAISAIEEYISKAIGRNPHKSILKIGKISGNLSKITGIGVTGLEYLNGEISGLELTFDLGTVATSIWVSSEVGAALGGPYGFAAGVAVGVVAEYVIKPLYVNYVKPHVVVPAQKSYNSWWTGFYNQIIFNISNYY